MSLNEARELREIIKAKGLHCTVPRCVDGRYFARIWSARGCVGAAKPVDFYSLGDWQAWKIEADRQDLVAKLKSRPRSPIEMMIDKACGIE